MRITVGKRMSSNPTFTNLSIRDYFIWNQYLWVKTSKNNALSLGFVEDWDDEEVESRDPWISKFFKPAERITPVSVEVVVSRRED